jgi:hypothetical protein
LWMAVSRYKNCYESLAPEVVDWETLRIKDVSFGFEFDDERELPIANFGNFGVSFDSHEVLCVAYIHVVSLLRFCGILILSVIKLSRAKIKHKPSLCESWKKSHHCCCVFQLLEVAFNNCRSLSSNYSIIWIDYQWSGHDLNNSFDNLSELLYTQ